LLAAEQQFIQQTKQGTNRLNTYLAAVSSETYLLNRNGRLPATTREETEQLLRSMPESIGHTIKGSGISRSGDLGYAYGTATFNKKADSYLRIWRREGKNWKLALEVLLY
jgi:hypothetical protein